MRRARHRSRPLGDRSRRRFPAPLVPGARRSRRAARARARRGKDRRDRVFRRRRRARVGRARRGLRRDRVLAQLVRPARAADGVAHEEACSPNAPSETPFGPRGRGPNAPIAPRIGTGCAPCSTRRPRSRPPSATVARDEQQPVGADGELAPARRRIAERPAELEPVVERYDVAPWTKYAWPSASNAALGRK